MKKKQILSMVLGGVLAFSLGFGVSSIIKDNQMKEVRNQVNRTLSSYKVAYRNMIESKLVHKLDKKEIDGTKETYFLSDGSFYIIDHEKGKYVFQAVDFGDWDYEVDSLEKLENLVTTYISMRNTGTY